MTKGATAETPLPCPFCGNRPIVMGREPYVKVGCNNVRCRIVPRSQFFATIPIAIRTWNRRK